MLLAFRAAQHPFDPVWIVAGAASALGYGLRGILWHQLSDRENDAAAQVRTFAQRHATEVAAFIGAWIAFPLELAGLAVLLWKIASPIPLLMLALYLTLVRTPHQEVAKQGDPGPAGATLPDPDA